EERYPEQAGGVAGLVVDGVVGQEDEDGVPIPVLPCGSLHELAQGPIAVAQRVQIGVEGTGAVRANVELLARVGVRLVGGAREEEGEERLVRVALVLQ